MEATKFLDALAFLKQKPYANDDFDEITNCGVLNRQPTTDEELSALFKVALHLKSRNQQLWKDAISAVCYEKSKPTTTDEEETEREPTEKKEIDEIIECSVLDKTKKEEEKDGSRMINIVVQGGSKKMTMSIRENYTVGAIKQHIYVALGFPLYRQMLILNGDEMKNDSTLFEYGVVNGQYLTLKLIVVE